MKKFTIIATGRTIKVPLEYNPQNYIDITKKQIVDLSSRIIEFDPMINSSNFKTPSHDLEPGQSYEVKYVKYPYSANYEDAIKFLSIIGANLCGAHGLLMYYLSYGSSLEDERESLFSLDQKTNLIEQTFYRVIPPHDLITDLFAPHLNTVASGNATFELEQVGKRVPNVNKLVAFIKIG